jgi:integrase
VFCHPDGSALLASSVTHAWQNAVRRAGLKGFRFHDLRHAYASIMLQANVNPKVLQAALGHSSISVTMDVYGHLLPGMAENAALAVETALKPK